MNEPGCGGCYIVYCALISVHGIFASKQEQGDKFAISKGNVGDLSLNFASRSVPDRSLQLL